MLARLRALDVGRPLGQILFYRIAYWIILAFFTLFYRVRFEGVGNIPRTGGLLVVANHQSHLDPPLLGVFGALLRGLGTIPIKESEGDAGAVRTSIAQLKAGRLVVIFPEGSRSPDGGMYSFKRGSWLLLARSGAAVLPVAVEGCFDAWPRQRGFPHLFGHRCAVAFGMPIPFEELKAMGADAALDRLAREVDALRMGLREKLRKASRGRVPAAGAGDRAYAPREMPE